MTCLHPDDVTPERLRETVEQALRSDETLARGRAAGAVPLDGAERLSEFCSTLRVTSYSSLSEGTGLER